MRLKYAGLFRTRALALNWLSAYREKYPYSKAYVGYHPTKDGYTIFFV